jgi:hypothetical protein
MDYFTIPSTISILKCEAILYDELSDLSKVYPTFDFISIPDENNVELSIKKMLPVFIPKEVEYPREEVDADRKGYHVVDFEQSFDYSKTNFA